MAKKLYGTDPDQVPTNADLGTIAYQDAERPLLGQTNVKSAGTALIVERTGDAANLQFKADGQNVGHIYGFKNGDGGNLAFYPTNSVGALTQRMIINRDGNVTINTGNLVIGTSGSGIDFSASEGGGASSSILDDYEEGTWTPNVSTGSLSVTGTYVKVGKLVSIFLNGQVTTGGATQISGLPFNTAGNYGFSPYVSTQDIPAGQNSITFVTNGTALLVRAIGDNTTFTATALTTGAYIHASFVYEAA